MINVQLWCFSHHVPLSLASWAVCLLQWTCDTKCSLLCGEKGRSCWITPWPSCEEICSATSISGCWLTTSTTTSFSLTLRCTCSASRTWELDWPVLHDTGVSDDQKLLSPQNVDPYKNFCFKYCPETDRASDHPTVYKWAVTSPVTFPTAPWPLLAVGHPSWGQHRGLHLLLHSHIVSYWSWLLCNSTSKCSHYRSLPVTTGT